MRNNVEGCWRLILTLVLLAIAFLSISQNLYAAAYDENAKLWTKFDVNGYLLKQQKIKYWLDAQLRFVTKANRFESFQLEALLGYEYTSNIDFWLGYRRVHDSYRAEVPQSNTLWQEVDWQFFHCPFIKWNSRTRFEQIRPTNNAVWLLRLRERIKVTFPSLYKKNVVPAFWNEFFFHLKNAPYATHDFFSQNRFFVGFDIQVTKIQKLEIGYINQLHFESEKNHPNQMNHILFIDYDFDLL